MLTINEIKNAVIQIAPEYPVKQVQLFGSYADGLATDKSDIDVIVEFSEWPVSAWDYCGFKQALSDYLNIEVDMIRYPFSEQISSKMDIRKVVQLYG